MKDAGSQTSAKTTLSDLKRGRREIDEIDDKILALLRLRAGMSAAVGVTKKNLGLSAHDEAREIQILNHAENVGGAYARRVFEAILKR